VTRLLRSVARMSRAELWSRATERARTIAERVETSTTRRRWERKRLRSRLSHSVPAVVAADAALRAQDWRSAAESFRRHFCDRRASFPLDPGRRHQIAASILEQFPRAADEARSQGDKLLDGRRHLLGYADVLVGRCQQIDWHFDPVHNRRAPRRFWSSVPYLDPQFGDHKVIWELNRHQHWLALGRAAWLTDDRRYQHAFRQELTGWLAENPPLIGINWSSMLELGFRTLSWIWSLHFFVALETESSDTTWLLDMLLALDEQLNHIARHLSTYFSPNTHLLGEGLALYVAGRVLPELASAPRWEAIGRDILKNESRRQVYQDGGHAERSAHYHRYALDFYLLALTIGRLTDDPDAGMFAEVTSRMAGFCRAIAGTDGRLPTIGDDDGGLLFPICGRRPFDAADSLSLAASLLQRPDLTVGDPPEETLWMLGGDRSQLRWPTPSQPPASRLFPETGYAVIRSRNDHAVVDVGRHGFLNGGHAHADALSLVMSIDGRPFLVDPGTSTYTMDPGRRDLFRSTAMHNTLTVDDRPQSTPGAPFHWQSSANASVRLWRTGIGFEVVEGEHDGYSPAVHRRGVLRHASGLWLIVDHFLGRGRHRLDLRWHLDSSWQLAEAEGGTARVGHGDGHEVRLASTATRLTPLVGGTLGWRAPEYGQLVPALTLEASTIGTAPLSVVTAIAPATLASRLSIKTVDVASSASDARHRIAVVGDFGDGQFLALFSTDLSNEGSAQAGPAQHMKIAGSEFHTDARIAVLQLSASREPTSLSLINGTGADWNGRGPFSVGPLTSAADLHLDRDALVRATRRAPSNVSAERTLCAE
jgi:Heparinase II/III-like protein/Heparinase II/III N-terminus